MNQCSGSVPFWYDPDEVEKSTVEIKVFPYFFPPVDGRILILIRTDKLRILIQEAQKHTDPTGPDPEHCHESKSK
jgi:hypothetical protein